MPATKITGLAALTGVDGAADVLAIVDISDVTMAATGTTKKVLPNSLPISTATQAALDLKAPLASPTFTGVVTVPTPTNATDAVTKSYADAITQSLDIKQSVRVASTVNIAVATALVNASVIDGVTVATGDRVLLKDQTAPAENGIYIVVAAGAASRSTDADVSADVTSGMYVFVSEGTAAADSGFVLTTNDTITLGTTALAFTQFSGAGQITAGAGLTKTGNTLDAVGTANRIVVAADAIDIGTDVVTLTGTQSLSNKTFVGPALGTPLSGVATNLTGVAAGLTSGIATNIAGGLGGQIPYQSAANTTALLANGTAGQVLQSNGTTLAPTWVAASGSPGGTSPQLQYNNAGAFGGTTGLTFTSATGVLTIAPSVRTTGSPNIFVITSPLDTGLTLSTESTSVLFNLSASRQFATGALTTQREMRIQAPTYAGVGAMTITNAATLSISGPPVAGTNVTITNTAAFVVESGRSGFGTSTPGATIQVNGAASGIAAIFRAHATTPGNTTEWQTSDGTVVGQFNSDGLFIASTANTSGFEARYLAERNTSIDSGGLHTYSAGKVTFSDGATSHVNTRDTNIARSTGGGILLSSTLTTAVVVTAKGAASHTANLFEGQDSAAAIQVSIGATGIIASRMASVTLAAAATTLAATRNVVKVTGDAGGNTIATITGGVSGALLTLIFVDALVTITDTAAATADTINTSAAFVSSANDTMTLVFDGNKWFEVARAVN